MKKYLRSNIGYIILAVLLGLLYSGLNVYVAIILQKVIDIAELKDMEMFIFLTIGALVYVALLSLLQFLYLTMTKYLVARIIKSLRKDVFYGIFNQNFMAYSKINNADYISALTNDVNVIEQDFILPFIGITQNLFIFLFTTYFLIRLSIEVTVSLSLCLVLMFIIPQLTGNLLQKKQGKYSKQIALFLEKTKDFFGGYEVIRSFNIYEIIKRKFNSENERTAKVKFSKDRVFALNESLSFLLSFVAQFAVLFVAAYLIIIDKITMGVLVALVQLSSNFVNPVCEIMNCFAAIKSVEPIVKKLNDLSHHENQKNGKTPPTFEKALEMRNVSFSYEDDAAPILDRANIVFEKNKKYALLGESGCGKTTMIRLLTGYFSNYDGEILYDEKELKDIDTSQMGEVVSVVHQNVFLFDESIYDNICLFKEYSDEQVKASILSSGVDLFLAEQKDGIRTMVGEGANNLSGGQKQRIAVARALITKPQILIFDEGTSSLDLKTAHDIEERLLNIDNLTMITITHNSNSDLLKKYDHILKISDGKVTIS